MSRKAEATAPKRARGTNFTEEEERQLARSFLNISQDPTTGTGQKIDTFWERIETHFNEHNTANGEVRTMRSLSSKWQTIQHDVSKFVGS